MLNNSMSIEVDKIVLVKNINFMVYFSDKSFITFNLKLTQKKRISNKNNLNYIIYIPLNNIFKNSNCP